MKDALDQIAALTEAGAAQPALPPAAYTMDAVVEAEQAVLFRGGWICVGRADLVADPGDFHTLDVAGQSVVLLRDKDGVLRAFANTCRHRGARLVEGAGQCKGLRCPFHSWFYGLDGRLVSAPHMDEADGFDRAEFGLIAYRAEERMGFAFVCLNPDAPALDRVLGDFPEIHSPWPMEDLVTTRRREMVVACNWKAFLEVFNEYYHLPFVHPDTVDALYNRPEPANEVRGAYASQFGATEGTGGLLQDQQDHALPPMPGLQGEAARGVRYTWVFPNMSFAASRDGVWVYEAYPLGPDRCHVVQSACFQRDIVAAEGASEKIDAYHRRLDAAIEEDIPALENQQRGLACPDAIAGRLHPLLEANVGAFARWYAGAMAGALETRDGKG